MSPLLEISLEKVYSDDPDIEDFDEDDLFVQGEEDLVDAPRKRRPRRIREYHKEDESVVISDDDKAMEAEEITEDAYGLSEPPAADEAPVKVEEESKEEEADEAPEEVQDKPIDPPVLLEEEEKEDDFPQETINQQFETNEETVAEHHEAKKGDSILEMISLNHRYMFVKRALFKNDKDQFEKALGELEDFETFDESVEFLVQSYAKHNEWDMQSDEVKEFLKVLFRRHR